jgi:hypothetical protein
MSKIDSRIPLRFTSRALARVGDLVLVEGEVVAAGDVVVAGDGAVGCVCCGGRDAVAHVLSALFIAAVRGERARFSGVVADIGAARGKVLRAALVSDRFLAARYRIA